MAPMDEKKYRVVVKNLKKTVTAEAHLASLLDISTLDPEKFIGDSQIPMVSVTYGELDLSEIEAAYSANKDLLPLRNFLVGKKKGLDKNKCAFGLYCVAEVKDKNEAVYYLQVDKNLYDKVFITESKAFTATLKIYGLAQDFVFLESGKRHKARTVAINRESSFSTFRVTKEHLKDPTGKKAITFQFTISLECTPHWEYNVFGNDQTESILASIYELPDSSKDVIIVAASGAEVKAHKNILMAQSPVFCSMLNTDNATAEAQSGKILMEGNSEEGVTQMVRYLYGLTLEVSTLSPDTALELFQLSHKYGVKALERDMKDLLTEKGMKLNSVDSLLELYYYVMNNEDLEELRAHALTELSELPTNSALTESGFFKKMDNEEQKNLLLTLWSWSRIKI